MRASAVVDARTSTITSFGSAINPAIPPLIFLLFVFFRGFAAFESSSLSVLPAHAFRRLLRRKLVKVSSSSSFEIRHAYLLDISPAWAQGRRSVATLKFLHERREGVTPENASRSDTERRGIHHVHTLPDSLIVASDTE